MFYPGPTTQSVRTGRDEIEVQHTLHTAQSNRLVYGAAYRKDRVDAQGDIPPMALAYASSTDTNEWRVFANDEWRITPRLLLNTGGMFEKDALGHKNLSPRVALNFHALPMHTFRIGISVAYRTPSLVEYKMPVAQPGDLFVPNTTATSPNLMPEKMVSREIGYIGEIPDWHTSLDMRLYRDRVNNGVFAAITRTIANGLTAEYHGFEATLKHAFNSNCDLIVSISHQSASSNAPALVAAGQTYIVSSAPWSDDIMAASIPKNSASVLYSQRLGDNLSFSAAYYHQDALQPYDRGPIDYQPIQRRMDVRIAQAFQDVGGMKGEVAVVVQNLFNKGNTEYVANNVFDRRAYITVKLDW